VLQIFILLCFLFKIQISDSDIKISFAVILLNCALFYMWPMPISEKSVLIPFAFLKVVKFYSFYFSSLHFRIDILQRYLNIVTRIDRFHPYLSLFSVIMLFDGT
jgi:hypothetical protein